MVKRKEKSLVMSVLMSYECSPFTTAPPRSAEACEKSSRWLWKEKLSSYWCEKARKHICVTDLHDTTLAVKVALNPIQPTNPFTTMLVKSIVCKTKRKKKVFWRKKSCQGLALLAFRCRNSIG